MSVTGQAIAAFLTELRLTHRACDSHPQATADDHVVRELWSALSDQERSHLLLRLAWRTRAPLIAMDEPYDDATHNAYALHQATAGKPSADGFCGAAPCDVAGLQHEGAALARSLGDPEFLDESLLTAVLLHDFARNCTDLDKPPPPRGRHRPPAGAAAPVARWLRPAA